MQGKDIDVAWMDEAEDKQFNVVIPFHIWVKFNMAIPLRNIKKKYAAVEAIDMWNLIGRDPRVLEIYAEAQKTQEKSGSEVTECQR
jgi:hypothetical protein